MLSFLLKPGSHLCDEHNTDKRHKHKHKHKKTGTCSFFLVLMLMPMSLVSVMLIAQVWTRLMSFSCLRTSIRRQNGSWQKTLASAWIARNLDRLLFLQARVDEIVKFKSVSNFPSTGMAHMIRWSVGLFYLQTDFRADFGQSAILKSITFRKPWKDSAMKCN